jgi:hypothetical protein
MILNDFCAFILTHGRADNVVTYDTLIKQGYTGEIYLIIDNEDKQQDQYIKKFGKDKVLIFDKKEMADSIDEANNFNNRKVIVHARNVCFKFAKELGYKYFIQLDDDYSSFRYRFIDDKYMTKGYVKNLDRYFYYLLNFYVNTKFDSIALSQGGDYIGGESCGLLTNYIYNSRKCMNSFICSTDRHFQFIGSINEDVNTYTHLASKGKLFLTLPFVGLEQKATQSQGGGMTEAYLINGTYVKSFTTVLFQPSSVKVSMMGFTKKRLHHLVNWRTTVPLIIEQKYKK